ncbi:MAG TPA: phosphatidylglycerophosphatase A [Fibrobacteraceae bacterium]|nr:phosphatidylglycerophosphatase A [Fibrobacteraceae bacterium]
MRLFHTLFATWFGLGLFPKAPGTMGSIGTLPFLWAILILIPDFPSLSLGAATINAFLPLAMALFFVAWPSVTFIIQRDHVEDPQKVVVDEVVGQTLTFGFVAPDVLQSNPWLLLVGLALFRLFDITKPLGIHRLESLPGAWGVLADDTLGGIYAGILLAIGTTFLL